MAREGSSNRGYMNRFFCLIMLVLFALTLSQKSLAADISMSSNQSEYYFIVGENANIPIRFNNTQATTQGTLDYSITQEIRQHGFQYSNTNSQSKAFTVPAGDQTVVFNVGTIGQPAKLTLDLSFRYSTSTIFLKGIVINFVEDQSQKQNNDQQKQSEQQNSQQDDQQNNKQNSVSQQIQQMQQQMQEQMNQIFGGQSKQDPMQAVQNNQMAQDSGALKQQLQKQMQEQQQMKKEFQDNLAKNPEFQQNHNALSEQGYKPASGNLDPINSTSGNFEINYEKNGETATIRGTMENNQMKDLQRSSSEDAKKLMQQLQSDSRFQQYSDSLQKEGFNQAQPEIQRSGNLTTIKIPYKNELNKTASITAQIQNSTIKDVKLEKTDKNSWWIWLLSLPVIAVMGYFIYRRYLPTSQKEEYIAPIDYRKEALDLLDHAKKIYGESRFKDAYGKAAEAVRFYYSHKLGLRIELTNSDLIKQLKKSKIAYAATQKCLSLCGMVEFAKYQANDEDFSEIIKVAEGIIK